MAVIGVAYIDADACWATAEQWECVWDNAVVFQNMLRNEA